ncbi:hypothetical protein M3Y96_00233400 [Aphelenchoides besseyi]|nr:hypothetical protein M3Y96_00233400 [Aphelenchoides besseyi]
MKITTTHQLLCCLLVANFMQRVNAIICYDCRADDNTCNVGNCHGLVCLKMETSNMDNERKTVYKSCGDDIEPTQCKQNGFGSKLITRCACDFDFCNGDEQLSAARLQPSALASKSTTTITVIFGSLFVLSTIRSLS